MTVQYASDLHLEFRQNRQYLKINPLQSVGDVLVLAGDIVPFARMHDHEDFFGYVSDHFKATWWIPGNHEYYYSDIADRSGSFSEKIRSNITLLNNTTVIQDGVRFLFTTLWSRISSVNLLNTEAGMADFQVISMDARHFTTNRFNQLHAECVKWLRSEIARESAGKTVVVSHHVPTFLNYPEQFKSSPLNGAFGTELSGLIGMFKPACWIYGHHHWNIPEFKIGSTRY